jgi:cellulose synthase/poly-beta-1,6-N-acetylglucosamine synthase-like glycosyltransferase
VIFVDDNSNDKTLEYMKKGKKILENRIKTRILKNEERKGKAYSLNKALKIAKGKFVVVIDADSILEKDSLRNCIKHFYDGNRLNKKVAAVTANILVKNPKTIMQHLQNLEFIMISCFRKLQEKINAIMVTPGPLSVFRRDILLKLGGFDEKNLTEDIEIAWRILAHNYKIRMAFDAKAWTEYPNNLKKWWMQRTRWNLGGLQTLGKYLRYVRRKTNLRKFIIPYSFLGYTLTTLGIFISAYLIFNSIQNFLLYVLEAMKYGTNPFQRFEIKYAIDLFTIFGVIIFLSSLYLISISFDSYKLLKNSNGKNNRFDKLSLILFPTAYILLFPLVLIYSFFKFFEIKRKAITKAWLTK